MILPKPRSFRRKLLAIVASTTASALIIAGVAMLIHDVSAFRQTLSADLSTQADILALSIGPALAFDDHEVAARNLAALEARPGILSAALYTPAGGLYAQYVRSGETAPPSRLEVASSASQKPTQSVELTKQIVRNGEFLGTVYLRAQYLVAARIRAYTGIFVLVMLMSLAVSIVLSLSLHRELTLPMDTMVEVASEVVASGNYSRRVPATTSVEIAVVIHAFNGMLDGVQTRTQALQQSNAALESEIVVRTAAEAALAHANARLEGAMAAAEVGTWVWDLRTDELIVDRNLASLFGVADERDLNGAPSRYRRYIHPDDLNAVLTAESKALDTGVLESTDFRIVRPDESIRWLASRGKVQYDPDGVARFFAVLLIDITAQKNAEQALRNSEKLYRAIGESLDYGVWVCGEDGRNIYASESFLRLTGISQEQCSNFGWGELLHPEDLDETLSAWKECVANGAVWYREHRILGTDGRYHPVLAQGVPIRREDGAISGWAGINLDISPLKRTEEALREADRRKDEFLATLAHELRNPLAPIRHAVKILEHGSVDESRKQWSRDVIARQVERMALLLDDLLDVSRITRGHLELKPRPVELSLLIKSALETASPLIESKKHAISITLPSAPITLNVDTLRISQALSNLLTNAAKYTDTQGHIDIVARNDSTGISISVKDSGIGFDPALASRLFEMFSQVHSAIDRAEGGLGIGLSLVRGLVELHGGSVEARSAGNDMGSEFIIQLPPDVVIQSSGEAHDVAKIQSGPAVPRAALERIVVADDNRDAADSLVLIMQTYGYQVSVAYSGRDVISTARANLPQAMIIDIGMPDCSGYEVAKLVRAEPWGRDIFLVALTGWGQDEDKNKATRAGFDAHLTKPADPTAIHSLLSEFFAKSDVEGASNPVVG